MGLWLVGRRPVLSKLGYSNSPDLNASPSRSCARALHDSASVASWLLTYELLRNNSDRDMPLSPVAEEGHFRSDVSTYSANLEDTTLAGTIHI